MELVAMDMKVCFLAPKSSVSLKSKWSYYPPVAFLLV